MQSQSANEDGDNCIERNLLKTESRGKFGRETAMRNMLKAI